MEQLSAIDVPGPRVATVVVDVPLPHLDRPFDYLIPDPMADEVVPGCRVRVRFAGRRVEGFVLSVGESSEHPGRLAPIEKVISPEPVLTPAVYRVAREIADRQVGTLADVLRLAIPPRHARAEAHPQVAGPPPVPDLETVAWSRVAHGAAVIDALREGGSPRVVFDAVPGSEPERLIAEAVAATVSSGRGVIVCLPEARQVTQFGAAVDEALGAGFVAQLSSLHKSAVRYRSFISVLRREVPVVVGTRAAAWAPVDNLGLVIILDDGNDLHAEQRAPYPHAREVLLTRAIHEDAGVVILAHARTAEATSLVRQGWCQPMGPDVATRRRAWPRVLVTDGTERGDTPVRLPDAVFQQIRQASGPVLVQVPRQGYRSALACQDCRARAECRACAGPLIQTASMSPPRCRWCARSYPDWSCAECGGRRFRAPVVGQLRTAEEFAHAFPDREVVTSGGDQILETAPSGPCLVLATPGAEPVAEGGYAGVVLLDTWLMLARDDIRVVAESHRRWFEALALARRGASAVAVGDPAVLQALVRADPISVAERDLDERAQTHAPPIGRLILVDGPADVLADLARRSWTPHTEVLGPVPWADQQERLILRAPRAEGLALAAALKAAAAERSAAKAPALRIQVDPISY